jgi:hypothetical protein
MHLPGLMVERFDDQHVGPCAQFCRARKYQADHLLGRLCREVARVPFFMRPHAPVEESSNFIAMATGRSEPR